ncbi:ABC transporter permease [Celeribacter indicus]|uniref:ABC transporter permease n=1 Tax=Celeribacter indicus TaxID=1208324 RepID=A0A0B5E1J2_9RHOB|nr:ABC transporter permease [Celeribacter indicus]AJE49124.1 ABC transporter permease [Celeribacter indicus]SDX17048.1 monosaccharide ABC transporter membrane protein, CUT2 family [Celeribacter indicus]
MDARTSKPDRRSGGLRFSQEGIVFLLTLAMFAGFSLLLPKFLTSGNVIALMRSVSVLGILSLGMCIVVIGRGVDLTMVATLVVGMVWAVKLANEGVPFGVALGFGAGLVSLFGLVVGLIVAFAEIPAIFATLAMAPVIFGIGNPFLFKQDTHNAPAGIAWLRELGFGMSFGIPNTIWVFAAVALLVHLMLRYTRFGRSIHALGDNPSAARLTGFPVRPIIVAQYVMTALVAYLVGLVIVASNSGINSRLAYTTLVYDVLLVVVLGGIGLSGGRGGVRNVLVGTFFVGTLLSGMTILNLTHTAQNLIKSVVMLMALVAETFANPRDEQTSQQGDI